MRLSGGVCEVRFDGKHFGMARLVDQIYRAKAEELLANICGQPMKLVCQFDRNAPAARPAPRKAPKKPAPPPLPHADHPIAVDTSAMDAAAQANFAHTMEIFDAHGGGTVVEKPAPPEGAKGIPPEGFPGATADATPAPAPQASATPTSAAFDAPPPIDDSDAPPEDEDDELPPDADN